MSSIKLNIYCVTNKVVPSLENTNLKLAAVGQNKFPESYLRSNFRDNIFYKEKHYSELTFHYWYWKNMMNISDNDWNGFSQRRRHWIKNSSVNKPIDINNLDEHILKEPENDWNNFDSIICKSIYVNKVKKIKILKRGWKSLFKNPSILFDEKKQNLLLHFDMHHGYGNLKKAIEQMEKEDRSDFYDFVNSNTKFNPHIMYISKNIILDKWFIFLFSWLSRCEKIFGLNKMTSYDTGRLYAYLAERYASFWFKKYTKYKEHPWTFIDI
jgi:hypothetical protein